MENEDYILGEYEYRALMAIRDFAEHAFCGYPEGHGKEEEQEVANSFAWLVMSYIDLLDASKETVDDYIGNRQCYQSLIRPKN